LAGRKRKTSCACLDGNVGYYGAWVVRWEVIMYGIGEYFEGVVNNHGEDEADASYYCKLYNGSDLREASVWCTECRGCIDTYNSLVHGAWTALKPETQTRMLDVFICSFECHAAVLQIFGAKRVTTTSYKHETRG
jgi:hypothetical protein